VKIRSPFGSGTLPLVSETIAGKNHPYTIKTFEIKGLLCLDKSWHIPTRSPFT
jgi:hypothetical protein